MQNIVDVIHEQYGITSENQFDGIQIDLIDVNETISELSYLTHNYFRYYGKFPSKVGRLIIERYANHLNRDNDIVLDNYVGSGTSMVEAKMAGFDSFGTDINPLGVLASNVKTYCIEPKRLKQNHVELQHFINSRKEDGQVPLFDKINSSEFLELVKAEKARMYKIYPDIEKWFLANVIDDLSFIKCAILEQNQWEREISDFFLLAFLAIIRRVSVAYDGEVRPHVNKNKKQRDVFDAFNKKCVDMIDRMKEWNAITSDSNVSKTVLLDNRELSKASSLQQFLAEQNKQVGLIISHPPYLNCFDYISVYKPEIKWADGIYDVLSGYDYNAIKKMEIKSWPANNQIAIDKYWQANKEVYTEAFKILRTGGYCCIIIGDCTIKGKVLMVHKILAQICREIGFELMKIIYRTTSYGTGKYAYKSRAGYNESEDMKKDGILVLRKP